MLFFFVSFCLSEASFRKCSHSKFCERNRYLSLQKWTLIEQSIKNDKTNFEATIVDKTHDQNFKLSIKFLSCGSVYFKLNPVVSESFQRFNLLNQDTVFDQKEITKYIEYSLTKNQNGEKLVGSNSQTVAIINHPFSATISDKNGQKIVINPDDSAVFENNLPETQYPDLYQASEFDYKTDVAKNGPTSVAMTFDFVTPDVRLSGLASHSLPLNLPTTLNSDPIRLFNTYPYPYENNSTAAMQGSVPFIFAHSKSGCDGLIWSNPSETWIDISDQENKGKRVRFISEGGFIEFFAFSSNSHSSLISTYTTLTGRPLFVPEFALGFHQGRWGYYSDIEVESVSKQLDDHLIPHETMWLSIDSLANKREFFTFSEDSLPNPERLFDNFAKGGRYIIVPVGPNLQAMNENYSAYKEAKEKDLLIKTKDNKIYYGNSYPGKCAWPDFLNPKTPSWWESLFSYQSFKHSRPNMFVWSDYNQPVVFEDYEMTLERGLIHHNNIEEREVHNIHGHLISAAAYKGLVNRDQVHQRPFLLTTSYFAGTQKYSIVTVTGSSGNWDTLKSSVSLILQLGLCGHVYSGVDVGGYFDHPDHQLIARWYQVGAWVYPFFRTNCHHLGSHRDIYLLNNDENQSFPYEVAREAVVDRYLLLPYWYTLAHKTHETGEPLIKPIWWDLKSDDYTQFADVDNTVMLGDSLFIVPFLENEQNEQEIKFPGASRWYCYRSLEEIKEKETTIHSKDGRTAVFIKGGKIIPKKVQLRRSSKLMKPDPLQLIIAVDHNNKASGEVYIDDGCTFNYETSKEYINTFFEFDGKTLTSNNRNKQVDQKLAVAIDRITITGLAKMPTKVHDKNDQIYTFTIENNILIVNRLGISINTDFELYFDY